MACVLYTRTHYLQTPDLIGAYEIRTLNWNSYYQKAWIYVIHIDHSTESSCSCLRTAWRRPWKILLDLKKYIYISLHECAWYPQLEYWWLLQHRKCCIYHISLWKSLYVGNIGGFPISFPLNLIDDFSSFSEDICPARLVFSWTGRLHGFIADFIEIL